MRTWVLFCGILATVCTGRAELKPLFNGKNLDGWVHEGPRMTFAVRNGNLVSGPEGFPPNWLHTERQYQDFRLQLEFKLAAWGEAAVILRAPRLGRPMQSGIAVYLAHDYHAEIGTYGTGSLAGLLPPKQPTKFGYGAWHRLAVEARGSRLQVWIDDLLQQDVDLQQHPELRLRPVQGYLGFPATGYGYELRNIVLADYGQPVAHQWLLNDQSLQQWRLRGGGTWQLRDGVLTGANGDGVFYAPGKFKNFELSLLVRTANHVNSGIFLRGSPEPSQNRGFEIQIYSPPDSVYPTGSFYNLARGGLPYDHEGEWIFLQVRVDGGHGLLRVNGQTLSQTGRLPILEAGQIGFQIHMDNASVAFREIAVRPLP